MYGGGGRYGIWGIDPYGPDLMDKALKTANGMGELQRGGYQQQGLGLANMQRQSDLAYQPQMRQQEQDLNQAKIMHLRAQADMANREKDPAYQFKELMRQYSSAPDKSREKLFYGSLLNNMMGSGMGGSGGMGMTVPGVGSGQSGASGAMGGGAMGAPPGQNGAIVNQGTISARSKRGMEYTVPNADGTVTTYASPTMANETQQQGRLSAEQEANVLYNSAKKGVEPYQGLGATPRMLGDLFDYYTGSKKSKEAAGERLTGLAMANRVKPEVASTVARMSTGASPGIELVREFEKSIFPGMPLFSSALTPNSIQNKVNENYLPLQKQGVSAAVGAGRNNFPMDMEQAPQYAQGAGQPMFQFTGDNARDAAMLTQMYSPQSQPSGQSQAKPKSGWGEDGKTYSHSNGKSYTRAELEKIAKGGK